MHVYKLGVVLHEYYLMKMFMARLEGNTWSWCEGLPSECLYSLKDFHTTFYEHFKEQYPSLSLVQDCFLHVKGFIEFMAMMSLWMKIC